MADNAHVVHDQKGNYLLAQVELAVVILRNILVFTFAARIVVPRKRQLKCEISHFHVRPAVPSFNILLAKKSRPISNAMQPTADALISLSHAK